jgi:lipopolysaccharide export system protein LptA
VERQSNALTFSKVEGNRTIFTVQASKSTDFKGEDASLLEDVQITVFGKAGDRHDVIHTQSCKYAKADGGIQCSGEVLMELQNAADAENARQQSSAPRNVVRVQTGGVTFERATGRAQTVQPVKFSFPNGSGDGIGAVYFSDEGVLRLVRDVHLDLHAPGGPGKGTKKEAAAKAVALRGSSLEFGKASRLVQLFGPVTATTAAQRLTAGELTLAMDAQFRARTLVATPGAEGDLPEVTSESSSGKTILRAEKLTANFVPEGWIASLLADGNVQGSSPSGSLQSERGKMEMWPRVNQAKLLTLHGNVHLQTQDGKDGTSRGLRTNALQLNFAGGQTNRVQKAETLERGAMEWTDAASARSKLQADKLSLDFANSGKAQQLIATGSVQTEREIKGKPLQTATAANGVVQMDSAGQWSQITLQGSVHLNEGDQSAEAKQAVFDRAAQTSLLTGLAVVRDASSETRAPRITFHQNTGELEAEGSVRSTEFSGHGSSVNLSSGPANLSAERLRANTKTGRALYTGHARLWQGPSVLEADSIELLRDTRVLNAIGNVRGVFPQASAGQGPKKQAELWHVSSGSLTYWDAENRAYLEKNVVVQLTDQRMRGAALELYFTHGDPGAKGGAGSSQISRAVGTGGVIVEQGDRRGTAERGVYTAANQEFVLSGGNPTLYDPIQGTTTGHELTFYSADDTIIINSGNGLRTLTKHRVQK